MSARRSWPSLGAPLLALWLAACGSTVAVPAPALGAPPPLPPMPAATIALPITLAMSAVATPLGRGFPPRDSLDRASCAALLGALCHEYAYQRDSLGLEMRGDRMTLRTRLRYRGRVAVPGLGGLASCGWGDEAPRRAELRLSTALYWRTDWRVGARDTDLDARLSDACRVTLLAVDATPMMQRVVDAQLLRVRRTLDSLVPALADLRPAADSLWRTLQEPMPLDSARSAWLVMAPEGVSLAPLAGTGSAITTGIVVTARPRVVLGERPRVDVRPLPPLTLARPARGLHVPVEIEVPFADLSRRATALLVGQTAGDGLRVRAVNVWAVGDTVAVKVDLEGRLHGSLYLVGRYGWDAASRQLRLDDLRYTVASDRMMSRVKATLGAPLIRRALGQATSDGRVALGAQLDSMRLQLTSRLNGRLTPGMTMGGGVTDVRVDGVHATSGAFVVRAVLDGVAGLYVR